MQDVKTLEIKSTRLILKPISLTYRDEIFQEFTDKITTYMFPKPAATIAETERFIHDTVRHEQDGQQLTLVILKQSNLEFLGVCGIQDRHTDTPALGIWIKQSAHGNGYGREAIHALKHWADEHLEYEYLVYPVDRRNVPSRKIPESLGGKMGREYQQMNLSGNLLDTIEYRIYR